MSEPTNAVLAEKIEHIEERITEIAGNFQVLTKSVKVLNDNHHQLELDTAKLKASFATIKSSNILNDDLLTRENIYENNGRWL